MGAERWIRVEGDYLIISRCDFIYPQATEDDSGERDEERYDLVGRADGTIFVSFRGAWVDARDVERMLAFERKPKGSINASADDLHQLFREALAWGMTYGSKLYPEQWVQMCEEQARQFTDRAVVERAGSRSET